MTIRRQIQSYEYYIYGNPEFAVKPLQAIVDAGHKVLACFTQPDKPKGRGKTLQPTPVKKKALSLDIPVYQPVKLRRKKMFRLSGTISRMLSL